MTSTWAHFRLFCDVHRYMEGQATVDAACSADLPAFLPSTDSAEAHAMRCLARLSGGMV